MVSGRLYEYGTPNHRAYTARMKNPDPLWWHRALYRWTPLRDGIS
jgi:hypothetical protein